MANNMSTMRSIVMSAGDGWMSKPIRTGTMQTENTMKTPMRRSQPIFTGSPGCTTPNAASFFALAFKVSPELAEKSSATILVGPSLASDSAMAAASSSTVPSKSMGFSVGSCLLSAPPAVPSPATDCVNRSRITALDSKRPS